MSGNDRPPHERQDNNQLFIQVNKPPAEPQADRIEITVTSVMTGVKQFKIVVPKEITVANLKMYVGTKSDISTDRQTLMYKHQELKDDDALISKYGIVDNCEVTLNVKMSSGISRRAAPSDVILYVPTSLPNNNMDQLRNMIRGMSNKKVPNRKVVKNSREHEKSSIWTPEKQMEHELTRNRMKALVKKRKKTMLLSAESTTPDQGSIIGSAVQSPGASEPSTPPELVTTDNTTSSTSSTSTASSTSSLSMLDGPVTEKELKLFFPTVEREQELEMMRTDLYVPPQNTKEFEALKQKFAQVAKSSCKTCRRKIPLRDQMLVCKCGHVFCGKHRTPESHNCAIDYKNSGRTKLMKENPKIDGGGARKAKIG